MRTEDVKTWRMAAIEDGFDSFPTYSHEPEEQAFTLKKVGFHVHGIARGNRGDCITIWGPDGLQIRPPEKYNWKALKAGLRICDNCGASNVETQRYSFAGRCCAACRPEMAKKHEYPGWTS